jgi:hypothetical protein
MSIVEYNSGITSNKKLMCPIVPIVVHSFSHIGTVEHNGGITSNKNYCAYCG